jgi:uncharacterized protein YcsI (UPF0317 family)
MKKILLVLAFSLPAFISFSQFVARAEIKEKIDGICDIKNVYSLFPMFKGQEEAVSSVPDSVVEGKLNREVEFIKDKPKYTDKGMVSIIINCKGEVVQCKIDNTTKSPELDQQVVNIFKTTLTSWKAGKLNGKEVDSMKLWSFEIKKGKIFLQ